MAKRRRLPETVEDGPATDPLLAVDNPLDDAFTNHPSASFEHPDERAHEPLPDPVLIPDPDPLPVVAPHLDEIHAPPAREIAVVDAEALEQRMRRLEDAFAELQQLQLQPQPQPSNSHIITTPSAPVAVPVASVSAPVPTPKTDLLWDLGKRVITSQIDLAHAHQDAVRNSVPARRAWLVVDTLAEIRAILRMFVDPRYRMSWLGRIAPPVFLCLIALSYWWVPGTSVTLFGFGHFLDKAIDLLLAFFLCKLLLHEARRYRETAPDLPTSLRL